MSDEVHKVLQDAFIGRQAISINRASDPSLRRLDIHLVLEDDSPLTIFLSPSPIPVAASVPVIIVLQLAVLILFLWLAVREATRPLAQLAGAADAMHPDTAHVELSEGGPLEVAKAAAAFNAMQRRIAAFLTERMHILAAVSHDLQTPITRMRLRVDLMPESLHRDKLIGDLRNMEMLVEEGISYARDAHGIAEQASRINVDALVASVVYEYIDEGKSIRLSGHSALTAWTRPHALRRIIINLVDNALKFGSDVAVEVRADERAMFYVTVLDRGPGIAPSQLDSVLKPFYRVEQSRNRDTGGTGLGLAIAQHLTNALGGVLTLSNRDNGGLRVQLALPGDLAGNENPRHIPDTSDAFNGAPT